MDRTDEYPHAEGRISLCPPKEAGDATGLPQQTEQAGNPVEQTDKIATMSYLCASPPKRTVHKLEVMMSYMTRNEHSSAQREGVPLKELLHSMIPIEWRVVSMGSIPIEEDAMLEEQQLMAAEHTSCPSTRKPKDGSSTAIFTKPRKRVISCVDDLVNSKPPKQRDGVQVTAHIINDPEIDSSLVFKHEFCFKDLKAANQRRHVVKINATYRNTRPSPVPSEGQDVYIPTHTITKVHMHDIPWLMDLFPHAPEVYFRGLIRTLRKSVSIYVLTLYQNDKPFVENLFTERLDMPAEYDNLKAIMRLSPIINVLVKDVNLPQLLDPLIQRFRQLAQRDPSSRFYRDPTIRRVSDLSVLPTEHCPEFRYPPSYGFETWSDYSHVTGCAGLFEHRVQHVRHDYYGKAGFVPQIGTQDKNGLTCGYWATYYMDEDTMMVNPQLKPGDHVQVYIGKSIQPWKGTVAKPTSFTSKGQVTIAVTRPSQYETIDEKRDISKITIAEANTMTESELMRYCRDNSVTTVRIIYSHTSNELEQQMKALEAFDMPDDRQDRRNISGSSMASHKQLLLCTDHESLPKSSLFEDIAQPFDVGDVYGSLRPEQQRAVGSWVNNGMRDDTAMLTGMGGTGKTTTALHVAKLFLNQVQVPKQASRT